MLVAWGQSLDNLHDVTMFSGLAAINCWGITTQKLHLAGFAEVRHFAILPSIDDARWFIPLDSPAVSSGAFSLYAPFRMSARLKNLGVRLAARSGLPFWYRDRICIAYRDLPPVERTLNGLFDCPTRLALSTGAPGPLARRKPTVAVLTPCGKTIALAKLAVTPISERLLKHEATILGALGSRTDAPSIAPHLVLGRDVGGRFVVVQTPVIGHPTHPDLTPAHYRFLERLRGHVWKPVGATALVDSWRVSTESAQNSAAILGRALLTLNGVSLPTTVVHGDFAPWNLRKRGGEVLAFDWENAVLDGLPLVDEFHHLLVVGHLLKKWTVDQAVDCLQALAAKRPLGLRPSEVRALACCHVVGYTTRLIEHGHDDRHPMLAWYRELGARLDGDTETWEAA